ncbi:MULTISPECIES: hypothetical protein [unclassified Luteococcus]|uniref:hypothetical protein n=1 Tax=unclassified Luteococcus TaxID=2639923 RepID=UPI00313ADE8B
MDGSYEVFGCIVLDTANLHSDQLAITIVGPPEPKGMSIDGARQLVSDLQRVIARAEELDEPLFPRQTCPHCRTEHPGQQSGLEDLAQPLPL